MKHRSQFVIGMLVVLSMLFGATGTKALTAEGNSNPSQMYAVIDSLSEAEKVRNLLQDEEPPVEEEVEVVDLGKTSLVIDRKSNTAMTVDNATGEIISTVCLCNGNLCSTQPEIVPDADAPEETPIGNAATITVHIWYDANENQIQDNGENDIEGWMTFANVADYSEMHQTDSEGNFTYDANFTVGNEFEAGSKWVWPHYHYTTPPSESGKLIAGVNEINVGVVWEKPAPRPHGDELLVEEELLEELADAEIDVPITIIIINTNTNTNTNVNTNTNTNNNETKVNENKPAKKDDDKGDNKPPKQHKPKKPKCKCVSVCK